MKLRNNKSVPFLGKNLPKRQRKDTKISVEQPQIEMLPKPIIDAVLSPKLNTTPPSTTAPTNVSSFPMLCSPNSRSSMSVGNDYEEIRTNNYKNGLIPSSSESDSNKSSEVEIEEQSSYEEDSKVNHSLRRFSRGTPRSSKRNQLNSTMDKGTNTTNGKYGERDNPTEFSFSFSQVEHQSTIIDETPVKDYTTTSPSPVRFLSPTMETESDTEDEAYHAQLRKYNKAFPVPYGDSNDDLGVFDFNSEDSNEISLIPETDSDDSDLPRRSFDPVALGAKADVAQAASDEQYDRIQGNIAKWTDAITTGFYDSKQSDF